MRYRPRATATQAPRPPRRWFARTATAVALTLLTLVAPAASFGPGRAAPQLPSLSIDDPTLAVGDEGPTEVEFTVTLSGVTEPTTTTQPGTITTQPRELPTTGASVGPIVLVATALIIAGLVAFGLRRIISPPLLILLICAAGSAAAALGGSVAHAQQEQPVVTVQFHTEDGTATAPEDYTATSGTISFAPGQTTATIVVPINLLLEESGKTFIVVLTDPAGATISKAVGTATLLVEAPTTTTIAATTTTTEATTTTTAATTSTSTTQPTTTSTTTSSTTTTTTTTTEATTTTAATTTSTSTTQPTTTSSTTTTSTTTTVPPIAPTAVDQTVTVNGEFAGSLVDDGDDLGTPTATIINVNAVQGPGALTFGIPTEVGDVNGRLCGVITVATDGSYSFTPSLPGPRECVISYTLSNAGGTSTATETIQVV